MRSSGDRRAAGASARIGDLFDRAERYATLPGTFDCGHRLCRRAGGGAAVNAGLI